MSQSSEANEHIQQALSETTIEVLEWFDRALPILHALPAQFRVAGWSAGSDQLVALVTALESLLQFAVGVAQAPLVPATVQGEFVFFYRELAELGQEVNEAMASADPVLLADLLEFELLPLLERLRAAAQQLADGGAVPQ